MQSISCASLRFPELYFLPEAAARALVSAAKNPIPQEDVTRNSGMPFKLENDKQFARRVERNNLTKVATTHSSCKGPSTSVRIRVRFPVRFHAQFAGKPH
jgi:hypothetical protein